MGETEGSIYIYINSLCSPSQPTNRLKCISSAIPLDIKLNNPPDAGVVRLALQLIVVRRFIVNEVSVGGAYLCYMYAIVLIPRRRHMEDVIRSGQLMPHFLFVQFRQCLSSRDVRRRSTCNACQYYAVI